ncbi:hypothetical protein [Methylobacter marinus]|uniref:hypothetical protein n=1 Tax=Methylobacter marinus TaxID=34058 RepID=UPI000360FCDA|nr:hypothetical protein [Methylobacter marinus]
MADIKRYTLAQATLFLKAAARLDQEEQRRQMLAARSAWASGDDFKALWGAIEPYNKE